MWKNLIYFPCLCWFLWWFLVTSRCSSQTQILLINNDKNRQISEGLEDAENVKIYQISLREMLNPDVKWQQNICCIETLTVQLPNTVNSPAFLTQISVFTLQTQLSHSFHRRPVLKETLLTSQDVLHGVRLPMVRDQNSVLYFFSFLCIKNKLKSPEVHGILGPSSSRFQQWQSL